MSYTALLCAYLRKSYSEFWSLQIGQLEPSFGISITFVVTGILAWLLFS